MPSEVYEQGPYGTNDWQTLRRTHTDYNLSDAYVNRRIIGLAAGQYLFATDANGYSIQTLLSKTTMEYDAGGAFLADQGNPVQHDAAYGLGFVQGRGNVASARRWDVNDENDIDSSTASTVGYNTTGSAIFSRDPLGHAGRQTTISYMDSFSSNGINTITAPGLTLAYPTTFTDPDNFSSTAKYNYDLGAVTRTEGPPPESHPQGAIQTTEYDSAGRVKRITNAVNSAYTRFVYPASQTIVNKFTTINELTIETYAATVFDGAGRVRAVAGDFPDNAGNHYSGQFTLYDQQGRAVQSTNPTEMTRAWAAAGTDAGWISTLQTYDWKGRPLITTNPSITSNPAETTTKQASYDGCGCAGGAVVTLTDEGSLVDIDPGAGITNVVKKRQQKVYSDALGRTVKTEVLNWDGAEPFSVYSTTVNTYNPRDQVTSVREYQGTEASDVYHETSMTYDGYGRSRTKHVPEQQADNTSGSTDHTTWNYNDDDTVETVTDARGITTTFGYNARRLLTSITYPQNLPVGVPATANVTYSYDAARNRSSISDTSGNVVTYSYDTLSRLESEARQFSGLTGTYTLAYEYNLAGQVNKVTDQSPGVGTSFSYTLDNVGRLTSVDSTGLGATAPLASNAQYRASGALKHRDSGNGSGMNLAYNSRGMVTQYSLSGVGRAEGSDYKYHPDGRVKFASDFHGRAGNPSGMSAHDKSYEYDHAGRLQRALTSVMANDVLNGTDITPFTASGSYMQTNTYDEWNNLVKREGLYWNEISEMGAGYDSNNRNVAWWYDADGRLISMNEPAPNELTFVPAVRTYDAAGRHLKVTQTTIREEPDPPNNPVSTTVTTIDAAYDGDGQQIKRVEMRQINSHPPEGEETYYLRSSVLSGQVITDYDTNGALKKSYVYGGGALLASRANGALLWRYSNPVTGDGRDTNAQGGLVVASYLDPDGMDIGATDPANAPHDPGQQPQPMAGAYGAFFPGSMGGSGSCIVDGTEIGCGFADVLLGLGAAQCPDNNCNPRMTKYGMLPLILMMNEGFGFFVRGTKGKKPQNSGRDFQHAQKRQPHSLFSAARLEWCLRNKFSVKFSEDEISQQEGSFGFDSIGAWFKGTYQGRLIGVRTDMTTYSMADVSLMHGKPVGTIGGYTDPRHPDTNFVASDILQRGYDFEVLRAAWVHELGNSLSHITGQPRQAKLPGMLAWDKDSGNALEECVYGGKVVNDSTVTTDPGRR